MDIHTMIRSPSEHGKGDYETLALCTLAKTPIPYLKHHLHITKQIYYNIVSWFYPDTNIH